MSRSSALLLGLLCSTSFGQAPPIAVDGSFVDLPRVGAEAKLPEWLVTGARVTYYAGSSTQPSVPVALGKVGENQYLPFDQEASGGGGYLQYDFVHVGEDALAVRGTNLVYADASLQTVIVAQHQGHLGDRDGVLDIWFHPQRLAKLEDRRDEGWFVRRTTYELDGRRYTALITHYQTPKGFVRNVYDLASGLLLVHSASTEGRPVLEPGAGKLPTPAQGAVTITSVVLKNVRKLSLPWLGREESIPSWLEKGQRYLYSGSETNSLSAGLLAPHPAQIEFSIERLGSGYALVDTQSVVDYGGRPSRGGAKMVYGAGTIAALFLDPEFLSKLRPGQVLDTDPLTRYQIRVVDRDERFVTLAEEGPLQGTALSFELANGRLAQLVQRMQQGPALITLQVQLAAIR